MFLVIVAKLSLKKHYKSQFFLVNKFYTSSCRSTNFNK